MSRRGPYDFSLHGQEIGLVAAAETLHMEGSGSAESLTGDEILRLHAFVADRVARWDAPTSRYDSAVLELCRAALAEADGMVRRLRADANTGREHAP